MLDLEVEYKIPRDNTFYGRAHVLAAEAAADDAGFIFLVVASATPTPL